MSDTERRQCAREGCTNTFPAPTGPGRPREFCEDKVCAGIRQRAATARWQQANPEQMKQYRKERNERERTSRDTDTVVYLMRNAEGRCLYISWTFGFASRLASHMTKAPWWADVTRIDIEHYPDADTAKAAELSAIERERPLHNADRALRQMASLLAGLTESEIIELIRGVQS
jgi:hypothetical protein